MPELCEFAEDASDRDQAEHHPRPPPSRHHHECAEHGEGDDVLERLRRRRR